MPIELAKEKYSDAINSVRIGVVGPKGVTVGGETTLPFLFDEGAMPNAPLVAPEIFDCEPADWPEGLKKAYDGALKDPVSWAKKCAAEYGAQILCIRLMSTHPDYGNRAGEDAVRVVKAVYKETGLPLIIIGSGDDEKDNDVLPKVSQAMKGENCLLGIASQNNYKTLAATCLADGHSIIAESPIDINIAKQVNILISDMGLDPKKIVMHPTTTSLGYGMEYVYSIMERGRLAAFIGDKMLAMPFILFAGSEVWKTKEAKEFGEIQGINWELATAIAMLQAGADLIVMRHPLAARATMAYIKNIMDRG